MDIDISDVVNTEWGEPLSINEFIHRYRLPQIAKIYEGENKKFQVPGNVNLQRPILLYKVYTCRKIHGRALAVDAKGRMRPAGPTLIIPESYAGWLSIVSKDGRTAGHFNTVGEVSRAAIPMFLVLNSVVGLKASSTGMCRIVISDGEILKSLGPYEDLNRQNALQVNSGNVHPDFMMYLKCLTQRGETIYLPYSTRGQFYCIASAKSHSINHVFLISNLLRVAKLPILVHIVSGNKPQTPLPWSNIVQLEEIRRETIILGCTMAENEPILLEINANSAFSLVKAMDERLIQRSQVYRRMCLMCTIEGDRWRQQIRVAHHVIPKKLQIVKDKAQHLMPSSPITAEKISGCPKAKHSLEVNKFRDIKGFFPGYELLSFLKYAYQSHIFPKKFWMFRKARKCEITDRWDESFSPGFDILKTYYTKYKGKKCLTLKIRATKDFLMLKGPETLESKFLKHRPNTDDGYVTSCIDDESIYHSIC